MSKNVVLCCDGTANEFARHRTNVVKLFFTLIQNPRRQVCYYHPGMGTMEPPGALTSFSRAWTKLLGQAIGWGFEADVRDAYAFLMNHFEEGDRIYLFGFSRGAYTAYAVASMLEMYGFIRRGNESLVPYTIRMMMAINNVLEIGGPVYWWRLQREPHRDLSEYMALAREFRQHFSINCNPHFAGVWDKVSSVFWFQKQYKIPYTSNNPGIAIVRHAISIDERRAFFRNSSDSPWDATSDGEPKDLKQVWFPGVHCDVGGGYPESESGLSKITLQWMLEEATDAGLLVDLARADLVLGRSGRGYVPPDPKAEMHESLTVRWWPAEFIPRKCGETLRMNLFRRRPFPRRPLIHRSAYERGEAYSSLLPTDAVVV